MHVNKQMCCSMHWEVLLLLTCATMYVCMYVLHMGRRVIGA